MRLQSLGLTEHNLVGRTLSHYRIIAKLGEGGMGEVYRAADTELEREVAIKVLPGSLSDDPQRLERFRRESKAVAALNHPNIVTVYSADVADGLRFLAMELVEGETLDRIVPRSGLPLAKAIAIGYALADALAAAHDKGVVHRDIKPGNVMMTGDGRVKMLDFGLAKLVGDQSAPAVSDTRMPTLTEAGLVMGTAPYMSPEQAEGREVDARSDIFSLGSVLYEIATGTQAFHGDSTIDTLHKILHAEPAPLSERLPLAPLQLQWILRKALAKAPEDRYQSARDLAVDLKALRKDLESDLGLPTVSASAAVAPVTARRSSRWIALGLVALALVAVGFLSWKLGRRSVTPAERAGPKATMTVRPLTSSGSVIAAAISPDGKYLAYVEAEEVQQGLNLKQIDGAQTLQLIPDDNVFYWGLNFTTDGNAIVFARKSPADPAGAIYRISTLGGAARKIASAVDSSPVVSPEGSRMAWLRAHFPDFQSSTLVVANSDGGEERALLTLQAPEILAPIFHTAPAWSPDGLRIAVTTVRRDRSHEGQILVVDAGTGAIEWRKTLPWSFNAMLTWVPEGDAFLAVAEDASAPGLTQIWLVSYPEGQSRKITQPLADYRIVNLTADGKSLVTVAAQAYASIWRRKLGSEQNPEKISAATLDGYYGLDAAADGSIVYQTVEQGQVDLAIISADGRERFLLTQDPIEDRYPRFTPQGQIVWSAWTPNGIKLVRIDRDGGNRNDLVDGIDFGPIDTSPDGVWVYFAKVVDGEPKLHRVAIEGGDPELLVDSFSDLPAVSVDGTRVAFYGRDPDTGQFFIGVVSAEGGTAERRIEAAPAWSGSSLQWAIDGESLLLNTMPDDRSNLWRLPLDGSEPERLTNFSEQRLVGSKLLADGETLIYARGDLSRDAMLLRDFR